MSSRLRTRRTRRISKFRGHKAEWIDPYPWIPGTHPEKRVFAALRARGFYFIFQGTFREAGYTQGSPLLEDVRFQPDFVLPEYRVIYDPFGDFVHSLPDRVERDALKLVYYEAMGYEFIHPWSSEIEANGGDWMVNLSQRIKGLPLYKLDPVNAAWKARQGYRLGSALGAGANSTAAANAARAKRRPHMIAQKRGRTRR